MEYNIYDILDVLSESTMNSLFNEYPQLFSEGAVKRSKKEKMDKYLKKYDYQGDKKSGTITVDGKTYNITRDDKDITQTYLHDGSINLSKDFEKLKNNKRRDAVLHHEIAHSKYHTLASKDVTKGQRDFVIDDAAERITKDTGYTGKLDQKITKAVTAGSMKLTSNISNPPKKKKNYTDKDVKEEENLKTFSKYEKPTTHANRIEFEADAYASQHKNGDQLKRAVREGYKNDSKNIKDPEEKKEYNKTAQNDMKQRTKAANDKTVDKSVYKESLDIETVLDEIMDLI